MSEARAAPEIPDTIPVTQHRHIQGLVFNGYGKRFPRAAFVFVRLPRGDQGQRARAWLNEVRAEIAWGGETPAPVHLAHGGLVEARVQLALTVSGLEALGVPARVVELFPQEAKVRMKGRARVLGDVVEDGKPRDWQLDLHECDALLILCAHDQPELDALLATQRARLAGHGAIEIAIERSAHWREREPFGFADGLSQPRIKGQRQTVPEAPENDICAGEIVLGYKNEYGYAPQSPRWGDLDFGKNGSYLVFRKLEQDVLAFWQTLARHARELAGCGEIPAGHADAAHWLAARLMGRWLNGSPLVAKYAHAPGPVDPVTKVNKENFFGYEDDSQGLVCPIGAHVRRANPRAARGGPAEESFKVVRRHRIVRRGRAYGGVTTPEQMMAEGAVAGEPSGLLFVCLQASIAKGFEFVQQIWNGNPGFHGLYQETDPIAGPGGCTFTIPADPARLRLPALPRFVIPRGGEYFFVPSRDAVDAMTRPHAE